MNNPARVISFVNGAHFIDHYSMLVFAAAVIVMGPALGMAYSELLPYATPGFVAFGAGSLLTGAIITETIFSWPGLGRLTIQAINARDYPLVQGCFLTIALTYIFVNLATDVLYSVVDPRIRYE